MDDVLDRCYQFAGLPADRFPRFQDDFDSRMALPETVDDAHEVVPVVVLACDVVAATKVYPFHAVDVLAEVLFESRENTFECVGVLLAEGMKVKPFDSIQEFRFEFCLGDAESRKPAARVVDVGFYGRKLRVDADAGAHACGKGLCLEPRPLAEAVEADVVGKREDLVDFVVAIDWGEYMDLFSHFFAGKARFVEARGGGSGEVARDEREGTPKTVAFEGADNLGASSFLNIVQNFHVPDEPFFVQNEAGAGDLGVIEHAPNIKLCPVFV